MISYRRAIYLVALTTLAAIQLWLGTDLAVVLLTVATACFALYPLSVKQVLCSDVLFFAFILYSATFALAIKCLLLQPLDQNLADPIYSTIVNLTGVLSVFAGYLASRQSIYVTTLTHRLSLQLKRETSLSLCAKICFPVGAVFQFLNVVFGSRAIDAQEGAAGGTAIFGTFAFVTTLAIACQASLVFGRTGSRKGTFLLVAMLIVSMAASIAANVKASFLFSVAAVALAYLMSPKKMAMTRELIVGGIVSLVFVLYVSPAIHMTRNLSGNMTIIQRLQAAFDVVAAAQFDPSKLYDSADEVLATFASSQDPTLNYIFPSTSNVSRFCLIQPVDEVVSRSANFGLMGMETFSDVLPSLLPSFLTKKMIATSPDLIAWRYQIRAPGIVGRPVIGLTASAFAFGGYLAVVTLPGLIMFAAFLCLNTLAGPLSANPLGIFITATSLFLVEKEASQILVYLLRGLPIIFVFLYGLSAALVRPSGPARPVGYGRPPIGA